LLRQACPREIVRALWATPAKTAEEYSKVLLDALFRPQSIAVIGASEKPTIGRRLIASLDRLGFAGRIYPINPNYPSVLGHRCYASLAETPEAPDVAAFCIGHRLVLDAFAAAAERGVRAAVIYDGGFAERGDEGRRLQEKIAGICREAGIALCGPNCMGILNPLERNSTYLQEIREPEGLAGNVGILSQSGGFCLSLLTDVSRFGFSHIVSSGNEAVLTAADFLEYLIDDPQTTVIGGFIEAVREPERFAAALDRAAMRDKPVVLLKVGQSERARRAVASHTAGEAGDPAEFSQMLQAHRAIEVRDPAELTEVLAACQGTGRPNARRIGVVTSSGGIAELMLDIAAAADLSLPPLAADLRADLDRLVGYVTGDGNPLDAWGNGTFIANLDHALTALQASPDHDAVVFCRDNCAGQPMDVPETALNYLAQFARAAAASDKPHYLLHTRSGPIDPAHVACLRAAGIPIVAGIREGLGAIDKLARWGGWKSNAA
jgi:acetate---CoA ligase (ADP-forming)